MSIEIFMMTSHVIISLISINNLQDTIFNDLISKTRSVMYINKLARKSFSLNTFYDVKKY